MAALFSRLFRWWIAGPLLLLAAHAASAHEQVAIGLLGYRPAAEMTQRWEPFIDYLNRRIPAHQFQFQVLGYGELEQAIAERRVDFVLTNPAHYVLMTYRNGLSSPLATLVQLEGGHAITAFGGVIFARAERTELNRLADLKGRKLAAVARGSLGGFQAQALELQQEGIFIPGSAALIETGMPHDAVVEAVLAGRADAGFVRTGVLEAMAQEGKLELSRLKIVNRRQVAGFPFYLSTALYPEWPFAAMPGVHEDLTRQVAAALLDLPHEGDLARRIGIHGFTTPADYEPVRKLLLGLRLPPFEETPHFTLADIWERYRIEAVAAAGFSLVILILLLLLALLNRRLAEERQLAAQKAEEWHRLLDAEGDGVYGVDARGRCTFVNPAALTLLGLTAQEVLGKDQHALFHHHREDGRPYPGEECPIALTLRDGRLRKTEEWFLRKDGSGFPVVVTVNAVGQGRGAVVVFRDISDHRRLEDELRRQATTDALTRLPNRRYFLAEAERALARVHRNAAGETAVMMLDLDHFKQVNDGHGHAAGDAVLLAFAQLLRETTRKSDLLGRIGGEEFAIVQVDTTLDQALQMAERIRRRVQESPVGFAPVSLHYTVSIGVTLMEAVDGSIDDALARADTALYRAKANGRNRVEVEAAAAVAVRVPASP